MTTLRVGISYGAVLARGRHFLLKIMEKKKVFAFKQACEAYLSTLSLTLLRSYGRSLQLKAPTKTGKSALIKEIIEVLCGEEKPQRNKRGAPIKNNYVDPALIEKVNELKERYLEHKTKKSEPVLSNDVSLQMFINPAALDENQKRLLNDFLNSL